MILVTRGTIEMGLTVSGKLQTGTYLYQDKLPLQGKAALKGNIVTRSKEERASPFPLQPHSLPLIGTTSVPLH